MFNPMMGGGGMPQILQQGVGGGPMAGPGPTIPPQLMSQMQPSANPQAAIGGLMQDPRIQAYIQALRAGMGGMPR